MVLPLFSNSLSFPLSNEVNLIYRAFTDTGFHYRTETMTDFRQATSIDSEAGTSNRRSALRNRRSQEPLTNGAVNDNSARDKLAPEVWISVRADCHQLAFPGRIAVLPVLIPPDDSRVLIPTFFRFVRK